MEKVFAEMHEMYELMDLMASYIKSVSKIYIEAKVRELM